MSDFEGVDQGVELGNVTGYQAGMIREGMSARSALAAFREAGGAIRDSVWYSTYASTRDGIARLGEAANLDYDALPSGEAYGTVAMGGGDQYVTKVQLTLVDIDTGDVLTNYYTHVADDPHTPGEAVAEAMDIFGGTESLSNYRTRVVGGLVTSVFRTTPYER